MSKAKTRLDLRPMRPMTEAEVMAAALSDPDAQPRSAGHLRARGIRLEQS
jgi:hypothetical protein